MSPRTLVVSAALLLAVAAAAGCGESATPPEEECVPAAEVCNGADDDCDGQTDEDLGTTTCGTGPCTVTVPSCEAGAPTTCQPRAPAAEVCNGADDDCDGVTDEGCECNPGAQRACYGGPAKTAGVGACKAGVQTCQAGKWSGCAGEVVPRAEACNGVDDDCDALTDETGGATCETGLAGACNAGVLSCTANGMVCVQAKAPSADLCNGVDDDCEPATADGSAEAWHGDACDGPDGDVCLEGALSCVGGVMACSDSSGTTVEQCNGADDDCDGQTDEGFVLDSNPACSGATDLGSVKGDSGAEELRASGWAEAWYRITIEDDLGVYETGALGAVVQVVAPSGRFLYVDVYCSSCGSAPIATYYASDWTPATIHVSKAEARGVDDSYDILVAVRETGWSYACGTWQLTVTGGGGAAAPFEEYHCD